MHQKYEIYYKLKKNVLYQNCLGGPPPRHVRQQVSTSVDGGLSGGSRVRRPRERGPPSALAEISLFSSSFFLSTAVVKIPEGVVVGFQIFAWAPKKK